jgi:hypothetical protein
MFNKFWSRCPTVGVHKNFFVVVIVFAFGLSSAGIAADQAWIVTSSRNTPVEAAELAAGLADRIQHRTRVYRAKNGQYTVAIGPGPAGKMRTIMRGYIASNAIPSDSFLSLTGSCCTAELAWIVTASRETFAEAAEVATSLVGIQHSVSIYRAKNGQYAVALGPAQVGDMKSAKTDYAERGAIPADSYISTAGCCIGELKMANEPTQQPARNQSSMKKDASRVPVAASEPQILQCRFAKKILFIGGRLPKYCKQGSFGEGCEYIDCIQHNRDEDRWFHFAQMGDKIRMLQLRLEARNPGVVVTDRRGSYAEIKAVGVPILNRQNVNAVGGGTFNCEVASGTSAIQYEYSYGYHFFQIILRQCPQ